MNISKSQQEKITARIVDLGTPRGANSGVIESITREVIPALQAEEDHSAIEDIIHEGFGVAGVTLNRDDARDLVREIHNILYKPMG